ncbi:MAG: class I SAM-dependent RNA methyltransferase, partial [bacterium]|nr:class I SAM-dependent RNA methyltransferase [bacterium]
TRIGDFVYAYDARCFFQSHRQLIPMLVEHALGPWGDEDGTAYDLFAGVGLFSLPLARRYERVIAVEGDRVANRFAKRNAKANGVTNLTVERQSVESWLRYLPPRRARVVVDPPRLGLPYNMRRALIEKRPRRLTYVSCDAATLARDLKQMRSAFRIESLTLLDMFPQTGHMEAVVQLIDRNAS